MKIEIWSDYVCPFCYIGQRRLEAALAQFPHHQQITVEYKSYELSPGATTDPNINYHETVADRFGITVEEATFGSERIKRQANEVGLEFDFEQMKPTNTFDAHRLTQLAAKCGKAEEMTERLLSAYFVEAQHISDHGVLKQLAHDVGLEEAKVEHLLTSQSYASRVREDEEDAQDIGVKTVPFFVFDEEFAVAGLQTTDVFSQILEQIWNMRQTDRPPTKKQAETIYCDGESCSRV